MICNVTSEDYGLKAKRGSSVAAVNGEIAFILSLLKGKKICILCQKNKIKYASTKRIKLLWVGTESTQ